MGIKGLLPFVEKACKKGHISDFKSKTIAVDISCLLHRSFTACAYDVATGNQSQAYINFIKRYIGILLNQGCHIILVFDGQPLPAKKAVNDKRAAARKENLKLGRLSMASGDSARAYKYFQMSAGITPEIIQHTISELRNLPHVDILVAPYEADAQLTFLVKRGIADAVMTEDSDLIPYGCPKIIFKLSLTGECVIYNVSLLYNCVGRTLLQKFNLDLFRRLCILTGCDYFDGIPKVGLKKSLEAFTRLRDATDFTKIAEFLKRLPYSLSLRKVTITDEMVKGFVQAEFTFLYQIVFDPIQRAQIPLHEYPKEIHPNILKYLPSQNEFTFWFAGKALSPGDSFRRAIGNSNLNGEDRFTMDEPNVSSIYHPERLKECKPVEIKLLPDKIGSNDSAYSSLNISTISNESFSHNESLLSQNDDVSVLNISTASENCCVPDSLDNMLDSASTSKDMFAVEDGDGASVTPKKKVSFDPLLKFCSQSGRTYEIDTDKVMESPLKCHQRKRETSPEAFDFSVNCIPESPLKDACEEDGEDIQIVPESPPSKGTSTLNAELKSLLNLPRSHKERVVLPVFKEITPALKESYQRHLACRPSLRSVGKIEAVREYFKISQPKSPKNEVFRTLSTNLHPFHSSSVFKRGIKRSTDPMEASPSQESPKSKKSYLSPPQ